MEGIRTNIAPPPDPLSSPGPSAGPRHQLAQSLQISPVLSVTPGTHYFDSEAIGKLQGFYNEQDFLRPGSNLSSKKLKNRKADSVVVFTYPLDPDYLNREGKYSPVEGGYLSSGPFSEEDLEFSQVSKDRFAESGEFDQIVNPAGGPLLTRSRGPQLAIM